MKSMLCILMGCVISVFVADAGLLVDIDTGFSGTQGASSLYYGAVTNGNFNANWFNAWDQWDEFVDFNTPLRWRDRENTADNYRYTSLDQLSSYDDQGAGVYWEADGTYTGVTVTAGRTGGTVLNTHVLWWDESAGVGYDLNSGFKQVSGTYSVGTVDVGDKIVIVSHASGGTDAKVDYDFSVSGTSTAPQPDVLMDIDVDFSGVQGSNGVYYGGVAHPNYTTNWYSAGFVSASTYNPVYERWSMDGGLATLTTNILKTAHTYGACVFWEADVSYTDINVVGGRTGGDEYPTRVVWWDESEAFGYVLNDGSLFTNGIYQIAQVDEGDKIAVLTSAGPGTNQEVEYEFSISGFVNINLPSVSAVTLQIAQSNGFVVVSSADLQAEYMHTLQVKESLTSGQWDDVTPVVSDVTQYDWILTPTNSGFFKVISQ